MTLYPNRLGEFVLRITILIGLLSCSSCRIDGDLEILCKNDMAAISKMAFSLQMMGYELNDEIVGDVIKKYENDKNFKFKGRVKNGRILDPLGNPYRLKAGDGVLKIWSIGKDGKDDGGEGDDILYLESL